MADFSNIDVEKLVAWEEEEDLWNISVGKLPQERYKTQSIVQGLVQQFLLTFLFFYNFIAAHSKIMDTVAITSSSIVDTILCVQDSLIIQKYYNISLMIQILSCVPAI